MKLLKWLQTRRDEARKSAPQEAARNKNITEDVIPAITQNEQLVMDLYHCIDAKEDITQVHPNADIMFKEAPMTFMGFREEMTRIFESFPDFKLNLVRPLKEQPDGRVEATLFATGTHVGKPYSFGPFPEIAPTGIAIKLEPEKCVYTIGDGKIIKIEITPLGEATGPPGVYTQIGGLIF